MLKKLVKKKGNVNVIAAGFLGTNNAHVTFDIDHSGSIKNNMTGNGDFSLSVKLNTDCRERILKGIEQMEEKGYTYYPSQFVKEGDAPKSGTSPCEWHGIW